MCAVQTTLRAEQLPDNMRHIRAQVERDIPVGFASHKEPPAHATRFWYNTLKTRYEDIEKKHPGFAPKQSAAFQLGTLGGGNHFIELCLDEVDRVWIMLHSGSRNIGNRIGSYFIAKAKEEMLRAGAAIAERGNAVVLVNKDLAYLTEGTNLFNDYIEAVGWAQDYAAINRTLMLQAVTEALQRHLPPFLTEGRAVNCHHNYVETYVHAGQKLYLTRKGAVSARTDELAIIPGSMGTRSYIVRGKGNADSFQSCSHGAGRRMSRTKAKEAITLEQHLVATAHVECRKDSGVLDESPAAYKDIDAVMAAQTSLVDVVHTLRQVLCVKG